jgi:hypothetical protein
VRVTKGPEPARPEWPEAGAAGETDVEVQTFPETGALTAARVEDPWDPGDHRSEEPDTGSVAEESSVLPGRPEGPPRQERTGAGAHGPVFVDVSGRRSRRVRRLGMAVGAACAGYAVVIVATLVSGNSTAPWLPVPGQGGDRPASTADTTPEPSRSAGPSGTGGDVAVPGAPAPAGAPRTSGSAAAGARPEPGGTPTGASAGPGHPGASARPGPATTATGGPRRPSAGVSTPVTRPTRPPAGTWPAPTPPDGGGTPTDGTPAPQDPGGEGTGSGADGPGNVATGPGSPVPVTTAPHPTTTPGATTAPGPGPAGTRTPSPSPSAPGVAA